MFISIRDVPPETAQKIKELAKESGMSLTAYLLKVLKLIAEGKITFTLSISE